MIGFRVWGFPVCGWRFVNIFQVAKCTCRVQVLGFSVQGLGFIGFRLGLRVQSLGSIWGYPTSHPTHNHQQIRSGDPNDDTHTHTYFCF